MTTRQGDVPALERHLAVPLEFRDWNIEDVLPRIAVPILVVQGSADQYGTVAQVRAIERGASGPVETVVLAGCGHSPHLERGAETLRAVTHFLA